LGGKGGWQNNNIKKTRSTCSGKAKDSAEMEIKGVKLTKVNPYSSHLTFALFPL